MFKVEGYNKMLISVGYFNSVEAADKAIQEIRLNLHKEFCNHG